MTNVLAQSLDGQRPRRVLVDTNLLLLRFVGSVDRSLIPRFKRTEQFAPEDYDTLLLLLSRFDQHVTTPHILTEVSNLLGQIKGERRAACFAQYRATVERLEEQQISANRACGQDIFLRLGLTDAAVTVIGNDDCLTLTDDLNLYLALSDRGARVVNFNHVRQFGWSS